MKAWPRYDREEKVWNVYVDVDGQVMSVGTTVAYVGAMPVFENEEFETKEDAIDFIKNNKKLQLCEDWLSKNLFRCEECGARMIMDSLGAESPCDEEWLECECGHARELTEEEIDHDLNMRFSN